MRPFLKGQENIDAGLNSEKNAKTIDPTSTDIHRSDHSKMQNRLCAEQLHLKYFRESLFWETEAKGAGTFHSASQSKEGSVGFGTSQHPIFMKLLPDHLWH